MRAVITVIGKDTTGIIAAVSGLLAEYGVNIMDISQTIMQDLFTMIMLVDLKGSGIGFHELADKLAELEKTKALSIRIQHEDIFNSMHKI